MKIVGLLLIPSLFLTSTVVLASETEQCLNTDKLAGRKEMTEAFAAEKYQSFKTKFEELCEKNRDDLECSVEIVAKDETYSRMKSLVMGDKCAETFNVAGADSSTIYFMTDKLHPLDEDRALSDQAQSISYEPRRKKALTP